jgi:copper chaperone CopZ
MRKLFTFGLAGMAVLAFAAGAAFAGDCSKETSAAKSACTAKDGKMISADGKSACPGMTATKASADGKACCTAHGGKTAMSPEECAKMCGYTGGKCEMINMSVKGMTCGGCETSVTTALEKVPGVVKVVSVSYKDGTAMVCVDPAKCQKDGLTSAVSNKGYEAEIIPAVATTAAAAPGKVCDPNDKAACAAKCLKGEKKLEDSK